jgi:hypothetical protein
MNQSSTTTTTPAPRKRSNRRIVYTVKDANNLYVKSTAKFDECKGLLHEARLIANNAGLSVDSSVLDGSFQSPFVHNGGVNNANGNNANSNSNGNPDDDYYNHSNTNETKPPATPSPSPSPSPFILKAFQPILSTTGGHSNTDHIIQITGDYRNDTIAEYKRKLKRRADAMKPEERGSVRWDQPRMLGTRRRRIVREKDLPTAPPEPPPSGYVLFIAQMTTKIRHDRPAAHHDQIKVIKEISKIWKFALSDLDRDYYNEFAKETREEYERQHEEFRATGAYQPSTVFTRLGGSSSSGGKDSTSTSTSTSNGAHDANGPWVRIAQHEKNSLEREISTYDTVKFPPRPETAQKPSWVTKIEKQNEREAKRREEREARLAKVREKQMLLLKLASQAKMRRLKEGGL